MKNFFIILTALLVAGCGTARMPPGLTTEQHKTIQGKHYSCVIGIEKFEWPVYSESLNKALKNTGIFKDVVWSDSSTPYDVVARVEETVHGTATIPIVAMLTFGILPSIVEEDHGHVFSIQPKDEKIMRRTVSTKYTGNTILGWVAIPLWLLPSYSILGEPENTSRYKEYLSYMVISSADDLLKKCGK